MEKDLSDKVHGGDNDFESLMEQSLRAPRSGDVLTGTVLLITRDSVIIDINYKCEGQVPLAEFLLIGRQAVGDDSDGLRVAILCGQVCRTVPCAGGAWGAHFGVWPVR